MQNAVIESSPVLSAKNKSGGPYFALALEVAMAPQPSRVTTSLIQIRARVSGRLFYVGTEKRLIGEPLTFNIAGMGTNERAAAENLSKEIVKAGKRVAQGLLSN